MKSDGSIAFANGGFIYWSPASGAWDIYGAIFAEWNSKGGPLGPLGFPVSGETSTPFLPGLVQGRFNDFQHGVIVWYPEGDYAGAHPVLGVQLYLERYECNDDFNVQINIEATPANPPNVNHGRMPSGGEYDGGGKELDTVLLAVPLVQSSTQVNVWMLCIHENTIGKDDEEGTVTESYSILNLWGLMENDHAHQNGAFTATFEMQPFPLPPVSLDPDQFRYQLFWPFQNFDTDTLSWHTYSDTFSDVAETDKHIDLNPFDFKLHLFEIAFYSIVYESLGGPGNCFGLCVESTFARENRSLFIEPIFDQNAYHKDGMLHATDNTQLKETTGQTPSPQDAEVVRETNIKHGYQVGANFIEWFLGKWITGGLHQPIDAFNDSKRYFEANDWPVISVSGDSDLSQSAHVLVPYKWSPQQGGPMTIWVANVNDPPDATNDNPHNFITVNPDDNSFTFQMFDGTQGVDGVWFGSPTTGGRMLAIPHSQLNTEPVTPGDAILALIVSGVVIICGGDGGSTQITDEHGRKFYVYDVPPLRADEVRLHVPSGLVSEGATLRRINLDPKTRIAEMARIPIHGRTKGTVKDRRRLTSDGNRYIKDGPRQKFARVPELYYLHRGGQVMSMEPLERGTNRQEGLNNARETVINQTVQPVTQANSLTFELTEDANGTYNWAILSPRMSASITAQNAGGGADVIHVDAVNTGDQSVTFNAPSNGANRTISLAVGGFSGGDPAERRWYELLNIDVTAGHSISAQVNDRGGELLLRNTGPAFTFELRVHHGMSPMATAVRPSVSLEANKSYRIGPQEWDKQTITETALHLSVFDSVSGAQIAQREL
jgi:LGFP repeat-containing protein